MMQLQKSEFLKLKETYNIKSLMLKDKKNRENISLRNHQSFFCERERSVEGNTNTTIKNIHLNNGFLLIAELNQTWYGSALVNEFKYSYSYNPISPIYDNYDLIKSFYLSNNYPNPFNPSTKISWQSPVSSHQTIKLFDVLANVVATLLDEYQPAGRFEVEVDVSNLTNGVYYYRLWVTSNANSITETNKMILIS